jgi:uncharacterized protein (TIGR02996 family)
MPVTVSLIDLVSTPGTKRVWPADFRAFAEEIESDPTDTATVLVAADWLRDHDEPVLEKAFRYFAKNQSLLMEKSRYGGWSIGLPTWLANIEHGRGVASDTPVAVLADMGFRLEVLAKELE